MTKTAYIWAAILAVSAGVPALAQMGGSMPMGGSSGDSSSRFDRNKMSSGEEKKWALCQEMTPEAMAQDKKCVRLQKKAERAEAEAR